MTIQLRFLVLILLALGFAPASHAAKKKTSRPTRAKTAKIKRPRTIADPQMQKINDEGYPLSSRFDRAPIAMGPTAHAATPPPPPPPPASTLSVSAIEPAAPSRLINFRLHPIYLVDMIAQHDTLAAARVDLDFIVSDRFTLGPSLIYQRTSTADTPALAATGNWQTIELQRWDLGLLSNLYLLGTSREGGLAFRPHVYYVDVSGEKQDANDATVASGNATNGWRAGAEIVYQKILPVGLNFEIGGGFTYHFAPYSVGYGDGGTASAPDHQVEPTVSVGIGWAF